MGKRRVRDLRMQPHGVEVRGFDFRKDRADLTSNLYEVSTSTNLDEAMSWDPDVLIVSTPPDHHMEYAHLAARGNRHFFVEASVLTDGVSDLIELMQNSKSIGVPSCTMRFHPHIQLMKQMLEADRLGQDWAFQYHMGQYLADWHPNEDFRSFYVSGERTGASREMVCFELVWLTWLFGDASFAVGIQDKITSLDIAGSDIYQLLVRFEDGTRGSMMIDVVSRIPYRTLRLVGEHGIMEWSAREDLLRTYDPEAKKWTDHSEVVATGRSDGHSAEHSGNFSGESIYSREMHAFLDAVTGIAPFPHDFESDLRVLRTLEAIERVPGQGVDLG